MRKLVTLAAAALAAATWMATPTAAQQPMRMIVPVPGGASTDTIARVLAEKLRDEVGETIVVENKPGAGQRIGLQELMKAPADGRTMLIASSALYSIIPHIYGDQTGFDPFKDVLPVTRVVAFQVGIAAGLHTGASNVKEFAAWLKANPDKASYGSPGAGTSSHFTGIMFSRGIGVPMTHIPFRGGMPALTDLMGGHIPMVSTAFSDLPNYHKEGKMKVIAIAGHRRSPALPDVMTLKEQGVDVAFDVGFDMHIKAGAPAGTVEKLNAALVKILKMPDVAAKLQSMGLTPTGNSAKELTDSQNAEYKMWAEPVKASGFKGE